MPQPAWQFCSDHDLEYSQDECPACALNRAQAQVAQLQTTISQQTKVCDEIREIAMDYRSGEYSTPGGLEHMGDVWRLIAKWDKMLASITPKPD